MTPFAIVQSAALSDSNAGIAVVLPSSASSRFRPSAGVDDRQLAGRQRPLFRTCILKALQDECGSALAGQMLEWSELDVAQISVVLDYADASAFTWVFLRWSGTTPARWRA